MHTRMAKVLPTQRSNLARLRVLSAIAFIALHREQVGLSRQDGSLDEAVQSKVLSASTLTGAYELLTNEQKLALTELLENPSVDVIYSNSKNSWSKDNLVILGMLEAGEKLPLGIAPSGPQQRMKPRRSRN